MKKEDGVRGEGIRYLSMRLFLMVNIPVLIKYYKYFESFNQTEIVLSRNNCPFLRKMYNSQLEHTIKHTESRLC